MQAVQELAKRPMSKATRATKTLEQAGIAFTVHAYDYDSNADSIGLQAAKVLSSGTARRRSPKSPLFARSNTRRSGHVSRSSARYAVLFPRS